MRGQPQPRLPHITRLVAALLQTPMDPLFFYWLIAAVVATPIVAIVRGITAGKRNKIAGRTDPDRGGDPR